MKVKEVKKIRGGEVLAEPVYTEDGSILIPKGTVLKSEYVDLLLSLSIGFIQIEDTYRSFEKPSLLLNITKKKEYVKRIKDILEKHIYTGRGSLKNVIDLANDLVEEICLNDMNCIYDFPQWNANLYEHSIMVTVLSLITARKLMLNKEQLYNIAIGCLLHDLGLRYIMVSYVNQLFDELAPADVFEFKKHTILAYTVLEKEEWLPAISKNMVLSHHEKLDNSGFPLKQKNKEIECKIIQLCDTYDCLISGMECKSNTVDKAVDYLKSVSGIRYDTTVVNVFLSFIAKYPVGTEVKLSNGKYGIVSCQTANANRPEIVLLDGLAGKVLPDQIYNLSKESSILIEKVIQ